MRICVSVGAAIVGELAVKAEDALRYTDLIELRLDWLTPPIELSEVLDLIERLERKGEVVVTIRRKGEGGRNSYPGEERSRILLESASIASYVDLEIFFDNGVRRLVNEISGRKARIILSYHDFSSTPGLDKLRKIVAHAKDLGGDIAKVITYANEPRDNLVCLQLVSESKIPVISFCMGRFGILSRVLCPLMGSPFTYASLPGEPLAPGQLSIEEVRKLWKLLKLK